MAVQIKVPAVGESITEATIGEWQKQSGEYVKRDEILLVLETDKASVEIVAEADGVLKTSAEEGDTVQVGAVVGEIDTEAKASAEEPAKNDEKTSKEESSKAAANGTNGNGAGTQAHPDLKANLSPATQRVVAEHGLDSGRIKGSGKGGRLTKEDAIKASQQGGVGGGATETVTPAHSELPPLPKTDNAKVQGGERREKMTTIRKRIAERLVSAQQTAAILTTFNEIDMSEVMALRSRYKDQFKEKYGISLGFMGFFVKACIEALREYPRVNAFLEGDEIIFHDYQNIGIAVSTEKGLMVPVVKNAHLMSVAEIELAIRHYAIKARDGKISIDDLSGGTFTVSNGGVFGSLMSTPILNPPQSGILGMHKIEERPMAVNGEIKVRPMMYVALSYDHRMVDGRESVSFLVKIKEYIEDPSRMLLEI